MSKLILTFFIIISFTFNTYAGDCAKPVQHLTKDTASPCTGYLFSPEQEEKVRIKMNLYDLVNEQNTEQNKMIDLLNQRVKVNRDQVILLTDRLKEEKDSNFTQNLLYFGLGALLTTVIAYGAVQATQR